MIKRNNNYYFDLFSEIESFIKENEKIIFDEYLKFQESKMFIDFMSDGSIRFYVKDCKIQNITFQQQSVYLSNFEIHSNGSTLFISALYSNKINNKTKLIEHIKNQIINIKIKQLDKSNLNYLLAEKSIDEYLQKDIPLDLNILFSETDILEYINQTTKNINDLILNLKQDEVLNQQNNSCVEIFNEIRNFYLAVLKNKLNSDFYYNTVINNLLEIIKHQKIKEYLYNKENLKNNLLISLFSSFIWKSNTKKELYIFINTVLKHKNKDIILILIFSIMHKLKPKTSDLSKNDKLLINLISKTLKIDYLFLNKEQEIFIDLIKIFKIHYILEDDKRTVNFLVAKNIDKYRLYNNSDIEQKLTVLNIAKNNSISKKEKEYYDVEIEKTKKLNIKLFNKL